jgi:hypothetical protein
LLKTVRYRAISQADPWTLRALSALPPNWNTPQESMSGCGLKGTLVVALTADDQARLHHHLLFQQKLGLPLHAASRIWPASSPEPC